MRNPRKSAGILVLSVSVLLAACGLAQTVPVRDAPQVRAKNHVASLTLSAVNENGRDAFAFDGETVAPVIRASPGDTLRIAYVNNLPAKSAETCAVNPCMNRAESRFVPHHDLLLPSLGPVNDACSRPHCLRC